MLLLSPDDWQSLGVTLALAAVTTLALSLLSLPVAFWLARCRGSWKSLAEGVIALPLVLPPTVLGFYLLIVLGKSGPLAFFGLPTLAFSFPGLVVGSMVYSMPFVVQPMASAFRAVDERLLEAAATLGAGPWDRFWSVVIPNARSGLISAAVLGFAHTMGEFGVVLMLGGSLPGQTKVASIRIYEHVERMDYGSAHRLAAVLVVLSLVLLLPIYWFRHHRETLP